MSKLVSSRRPAMPAVLASALIGAAAFLPAASRASVFTEMADAGQSVATAQGTAGAVGSGALSSILGSLGSSTDADLFRINIISPAAFSASTVNLTTGFLDTQLFLFTATGAPIYLNDDDASGLTVGSTLPAGGVLGPITAGTYVLGVSVSGYDPVNLNNQALFAQGLTTEVRGPASGLQPASLGGFFPSALPDSGNYDIQLTGAVAAAVPEPATWALSALGLGGMALARRRRGVLPAGR